MASVKAKELRRRFDLDGSAPTYQHLSEALDAGHLAAEDFSLRDLAEQFCGNDWVRLLDPRSGGTQLLEAGEGVDVTAFRNITGQVVNSKIMEGYQHEAFVASRLVPSVPTRLDGEKIPGVANLGDHAEQVSPGMPYPTYGFGEDYIETQSSCHQNVYLRVKGREKYGKSRVIPRCGGCRPTPDHRTFQGREGRPGNCQGDGQGLFNCPPRDNRARSIAA